MTKFALAAILLLSTGLIGKAIDLKKDIRRARVINVSALDTVNGYSKFYAIPDEDLNVYFAEKLDSMVSSWYVQNTFLLDSTEILEGDTLASSIPDSVFVDRLQSIQSAVSLSYNQTVKNFIVMYTERKREKVQVMLGLANYYFPMFEEILDKYGLPHELKYLPIIESALNPEARSKANAVGLWQFMFGTGKMYKLEISTFVDERSDPVKSTDAAARYLKDLYAIYGDWHLVIAAYNCGPGNVNKAIRRCGGVRDYWKIYYHLPKETRGYVPAYISAAYVMNNYQKHNLTPHMPDFPIITDTLTINKYLNLNQVAEVIGIPVEQLRSLNPQYRRDIIPADKNHPYSLVVPQDQVAAFIDNEEDIYNHKREEFFPNNQIVNPVSKSANFAAGDIKGKDKILYKIRPGDNLGAIAAKYHVRISDLKYWNGMHGNFLKAGQYLAIYVPQKNEVKAKANTTTTTTTTTAASTNAAAEKKEEVAQNAAAPKPDVLTAEIVTPASKAIKDAIEEYEYYTVRKGDSLWSIARKYEGITNKDIQQLNNLADDNIRPGQKLKIKPKA